MPPIVDALILPWSKEITYANNVTHINIIAQSSTMGVAVQTATMKIVAGGNLVKSTTATAGTSIRFALSLHVHTF